MKVVNGNKVPSEEVKDYVMVGLGPLKPEYIFTIDSKA